jgi:O-antigen/teichoic acid export membrane protein
VFLKVKTNISSSALGLIDQGLFSLITFGSMMGAALILHPKEFAIYALVVAAAALIQTLITAFVTNPAIYSINSEHIELNIRYIGHLATMTAFTGLILSPFLYGALCILAGYPTSTVLTAIVLGLFWGWFDLVRRIWISKNEIHQSAKTSAFAIAIILAIGIIIYGQQESDGILLSGMLATAYAAAGIYSTLRLNLRESISKYSLFSKEYLERHWSYSAYLLPGVLIYWTYTQGFFFLAEEHLLETEFGALRLLTSIAALASVILAYLENHYIPPLCRYFANRDLRNFEASYLTLKTKSQILAATYFFIWATASYYAFDLLYIKKYGAIELIDAALACAGFSTLILSRPALIISRVEANSRSSFFAHIASLTAVLCTLIAFISEFDLHTALIAYSASGLAFSIAIATLTKNSKTLPNKWPIP